jgi:hypothetical protein
MGVIYVLMINDHKILFISFFLYFIIVRKSVRTFTNEFTIFGGNGALSLVAAKKCIFHFGVTGLKDHGMAWSTSNSHTARW